MMPLHCEPLESRDTPLSLVFHWLTPEIPGVETALTALAARLDTPDPLPALPAFDALTPWGRVQTQPLPEDTLAVYVGPVSDPANLGEGGPVSWQSDTGLSRSPGMTIGLRVEAGFDTATVARHEFLHGIGVDYHLPQPELLAAETPANTVRDVTPADIVAIRGTGFSYDDTGLQLVTVANPYGLTGWIRLPPNVAADWIEAGNA